MTHSFTIGVDPAMSLKHNSEKQKKSWTDSVISSKCHLYLASLDHTRAFLIVNSCQIDVCDVTVVLFHSAVLHVVINEVHMPSTDRYER